MTQWDLTSTLVLRSNKKKGLPAFLILILIFGSITAFSVYIVLNPPDGEPKLYFASWAMCILFPYMLAHIGIQLLPGQGNLTLTSDGFRVASWLKSLRRNYRWSDVTGFYITNIMTGKTTQERVCFDLACLVSSKRRQSLTFKYDQTPQELADLMNQWKERYAPNPEGVELKPLLEAPVTQKSVWKIVGIQMLVIFAFGAVFLTYYYLFGKTEIRVVNNTREPIQRLNLVSFSFLPKEMKSFSTKALEPGQEIKFSIPHFDDGIIRLDYSARQNLSCAYLKHEQCVWHSRETIYLEPNGRFATKIAYCKPEKTNKIDRVLAGSCPNNDLVFREKGFKPVDPVWIEPLKKKNLDKIPSNKDEFVTAMQSEIRKHWHPPVIGQELSNTVRFTILHDGTLTDVEMARPSGNQELDESSLQAIHDTSPLPKLPPDINQPSIRAKFTFDYQVKHK